VAATLDCVVLDEICYVVVSSFPSKFCFHLRDEKEALKIFRTIIT
jgi:hypothetical protein